MTRESKSYQVLSDELLKDPEYAAAYLEEILRSGDANLFKVGLKNVASARLGGMSAVAASTDLSRESLYRSLSKKGNPKLDTLTRLLEASGLRFSITTI